jgi:uncharacterized repeat protein (TIGR01451 family)
VQDDLAATFAGATGFVVDAVTSSTLSVHPGYDGVLDLDLLTGTDLLAAGATATLDMTVTVTPGANLGPYANSADAHATSPGGTRVADLSTAEVTFSERAELGVAKWVSAPPVNNGNGTYTLTYQISVENSGDVPLADVQLRDDLGTTFAAATGFAVNRVRSSALSVNASYDGVSNLDLLEGSDVLEPGVSGDVEVRVTVTPDAILGPYDNSAVGSATSAGGQSVSDVSADGPVADADGDGDPSDDDAPTRITFGEFPVLGVAKRLASPPTNNGDGTYTLTYVLKLENGGDVVLERVQAFDDLGTVFGSVDRFVVESVRSNDFKVNSSYNGSTLIGLLNGTDTLAPGASGEIEITVAVTPGSELGPYLNVARAVADSPSGTSVGDLSTDGPSADANGNGTPRDDSTPTSVVFTEAPMLGVAKRVAGDPVANGDGTHSLTYTITLENHGDVESRNVQVTDSLATTFLLASGWSVQAVTSPTLTVDPSFDGAGTPSLLAGTDVLAPGERAEIAVDLLVTPGEVPGVYLNSAYVTGESPAGVTLADASMNGAQSDADGDGDPRDDNAPTPVVFDGTAGVGLAKAVTAGPIAHGDGTYSLAYTLRVENHGEFALGALQIRDELAATFAAADAYVVDAVNSTELTINPGFDGSSDIDLLAGSDSLGAGDSANLELRVSVTPGADLGPYDNSASAHGRSPSGVFVEDLSTDGASVDPDGNGDPSDDQVVTRVSFAESPQLGVAKFVQDPPVQNPDGTYSLTYVFVVQNMGDVRLHAIQLTDSLAVAFERAADFRVEAVTSHEFTPNPVFDGRLETSLLAGSDSLDAAQFATVELALRVTLADYAGPYLNSAAGSAESPAGKAISDLSTSGLVPDADGDGDPADDQEPTPLLFPTEAASILTTKSADRQTLTLSDLVGYTVALENLTAGPQSGLSLRDVIPAGFSYVAGSGRLRLDNGETQPLEPTGTRVLEFSGIDVASQATVRIHYRLRVGSGVALGEHVNQATPFQNDAPVGNTASASVVRVSDPALERTTVLGKVFRDRDADGWQDLDEPGIPGVRLATATGLVIHTDAAGRYHVADVDAGQGSPGRNFILKVDAGTLPVGSRFTTENPRVLHLTPGVLNQIDFGVEAGTPTRVDNILEPSAGSLHLTKLVQPPTLQPIWSQVELQTQRLDADTFMPASADLTPQGKAKIALLGRLLQVSSDATAVIEGHTDDVPIHTRTFADNYELAIARARAVMYELILTHHIAASRLSAIGFGPDRPIAVGKTRKARRINRRVEVKIFPAEVPQPTIVGVEPTELHFQVAVGVKDAGRLTRLEVVETLPDGMQYVEGSTRIQGASDAEPRVVEGREIGLVWSVPVTAIDSTLRIDYRARFETFEPGALLVSDSRLAWNLASGDSGISQPLWSEIHLREMQPVEVTRFTLQDLDFEARGAKLSTSGQEALQYVAEIVTSLRNVHVSVEGHTDNAPLRSRAFADQVAFSEARARDVQHYLQSLTALPDSVFDVHGSGATRPVDANGTAPGRQRNRRVDIVVRGYATPAPARQPDATEARALDVSIAADLRLPPGGTSPHGTNGDHVSNGANGEHQGNGVASPGAIALPWGGSIWVVEEMGEVEPRLQVRGPTDLPLAAGRIQDRTSFAISTNYAAFIERWEIRVHRAVDDELLRPIARLSGRGMQSRMTIDWDGQLESELALRPAEELLYVLRVYDGAGHLDETSPARIQLVDPHHAPPRDAAATVRGEQLAGDSNLRVQSIPIRGGRVQIRGSEIPYDVKLAVAGADVSVDRKGQFVLERLLPTGSQHLPVTARNSAGEEWAGSVTADVKDSFFFMVGVADVAMGSSSVSGDETLVRNDPRANGDFFGTGRLAFYLKGMWSGKYRATAQLDTREEELGDLFKNLDRKDPRQLFRRLDPDLHFLTYGDGSTTSADVNSLGLMYARLDWDRSRLLWGNYATGLTGTEFAQYNRSLYGASLHSRSVRSTRFGEPKIDATAFLSEPQTAFAHNEFLGTGASLYYLQHTDVVEGSEKVWVEIRDRDSDRVLENVTLERYRDYEIDERHGRIILRRPLMQVADQIAPSIIRDTPLDGNNVLLMVDYEHVPAMLDPDKVTWGARGRVWATEGVAAGATVVQESRDAQDHQLVGGDLILRRGGGTYLKTEYAESEASQSGSHSFSLDGGLTFQERELTDPDENRRATAIGFEGRLDLEELMQNDHAPQIGAWWKRRDAGFATTRLVTPRDLEEWGAEFTWRATPGWSFGSRWSVRDAKLSLQERIFSLEGDYRLSRWQLGGEVRHRSEKPGAAESAGNLLGGVRVGADVSPGVNVYALGQVSMQRDDGVPENNLGTLGVRARLDSKFSLMAEGSAGSLGQAARAGLDFSVDPTHELFGTYTLSTDRIDAPRGTVAIGQRKSISNQVRVFTDHQFTHGDRQRGFAQSYGLTFTPRDDWSINGTYQRSDLDDASSGVIDRDAASLALTYQKERARLSLKGEVRNDRGAVDRRQYLTTNRFDFTLDGGWTLLSKISFSRTDDRASEPEDAQFVESGVGIAYRPVRHSRLNLLGRYTFLFDLPAASQSEREDERSHVASLDAGYDVTRRWELGGRLALKRGEIRDARDAGWGSPAPASTSRTHGTPSGSTALCGTATRAISSKAASWPSIAISRATSSWVPASTARASPTTSPISTTTATAGSCVSSASTRVPTQTFVLASKTTTRITLGRSELPSGSSSFLASTAARVRRRVGIDEFSADR